MMALAFGRSGPGVLEVREPLPPYHDMLLLDQRAVHVAWKDLDVPDHAPPIRVRRFRRDTYVALYDETTRQWAGWAEPIWEFDHAAGRRILRVPVYIEVTA